MKSLSISTKREDIIKYLHSRLEDDTTPDAISDSLEAEILKKIPEDVSEMYVSYYRNSNTRENYLKHPLIHIWVLASHAKYRRRLTGNHNPPPPAKAQGNDRGLRVG